MEVTKYRLRFPDSVKRCVERSLVITRNSTETRHRLRRDEVEYEVTLGKQESLHVCLMDRDESGGVICEHLWEKNVKHPTRIKSQIVKDEPAPVGSASGDQK